MLQDLLQMSYLLKGEPVPAQLKMNDVIANCKIRLHLIQIHPAKVDLSVAKELLERL